MDKKIYSLAPTTNAENKETYELFFNEALSETRGDNTNKKKNKNIAVAGDYSSGKSSIIKTYFKEHYVEKVLYVSLSSFEENEEKEIKNLETSILKQIIYKERPHIFSLSRLNRIDKNEKIILLVSIAISLIFSLFFYFKYIVDNIENIEKLITFSKGKLLFIFFGILMFFTITFIVYFLLTKFLNIKVSLNFKGINLEESKSENVLNQNLDELLYFFKKNKYEIVVFEDIDRLKQGKKIFSHLREINEIINTAIKDKTIIFIYAVSDTLFEKSENRVKFFDVIIPVIPYTSYNNSINILCDLFKDVLDERDLVSLSKYIPNSRYIYDIYNEYNILKSNVKNDKKEDYRKVLYLSSYKVLYPRRFNLLYKNIGVISYFLSREFETNLRKDKVKNYRTLINQKIEKLEKEYLEYKDKYFVEFINGIKINCAFLHLETSSFYDRENNIIVSFKDIEQNHEKIEEVLDHVVTLSDGINTASEKEIFKFMPKTSLMDKIYIGTYTNDIVELQLKKVHLDESKIKCTYKDKISFLRKGIKNTSYYSLNIYDDEDNEKYMKINKFEEMMIMNNVIKSDITNLIVNRKNSFLSDNDLNIISSIMDGDTMKSNIKFDNPCKALEYLGDVYFSFDGTNITSLYKEILKSKNKSIYIQTIKENLSEEKLLFFKDMDEFGATFIKEANIINDIWDFIAERPIDKKIVIYYVYLTIKDYEKKDIKKNSYFYYAYENTDGIVEYLEDNFDKIENKLKEFKIVFNYFVKFHPTCNRMLEYIYEHNMYQIDYEKLEAISEVLGLDIDKNKVLESLYYSISKKMYERLIDNFKDTLIMLRSLGIKQNDSKEFLSIIKTTINEQQYEDLIKMENNV